VPHLSTLRLRAAFLNAGPDTLAQAQGKDAQARDWLVAMGKPIGSRETKPTIDLLVTSARNDQGTAWLSPHALATYDIECIPDPLKGLYELLLNPNGEKMRQPNEPSAPFVDVNVHLALKRHLFVTLDQSILNLALIARPQGNAFVLTSREAQRYIDLCLKAHEKYHIRMNYTANRPLRPADVKDNVKPLQRLRWQQKG